MICWHGVHSDIGICTQCELMHMFDMEERVRIWFGPLSIVSSGPDA